MTHLLNFAFDTEVGDDRNAENANAAVACDDHFGDGGHAHSVTADDSVHLIFGRRLESGAGGADIHTFDVAKLLFLGNGACQTREVGGRRPRSYRGKRGTGGEVLAAQRVFGEEIGCGR